MLPPLMLSTTARTLSGLQLHPVAADIWTQARHGNLMSHLAPPCMARIWGRTNCNFDANGQGQCGTDCNRMLQCQGNGSPPNTLAEFALNQPNNLDYLDISLFDGFNIPMDFSPTSGACRGIRCAANINGECPNEMRAAGGCNNPCTVYKTNEYCCTDGPGSCSATNFSRFFKKRCPDAYSYPQDDQTSTFKCHSGTNYSVTFCP